MTRTETGTVLLRLIDEYRDRDWGSPERNNLWPDLSRRIRLALHTKNESELAAVERELHWFMTPVFVLAQRMTRIIERRKDKVWKSPVDQETWKNFVARSNAAISRKDQREIRDLGRKMTEFLRRRNEHVLAEQLEHALG